MANTVLNEAGWTLDMGGGSYVPGEGDIRYKIVNDRLLRLRLVLAVPDNPELVRAMEKTFVPALAEAGIELMIRTADMKSIQDYYNGLGEGIDMVFLGENFSDVFDPEVFRTEGDSEIARTDRELYEMSLEMLRTEPGDAVEFLSRWVRLQERISETLPLIPLYSNMYFDFYTCELHDYEVARKTSWADAVLTSYMSLPNTNVSE
jgi:ABC-type transport system substrate-binding protein